MNKSQTVAREKRGTGSLQRMVMWHKKPKSDKELADELDARDRLQNRGYIWKNCKHCHGIKDGHCLACSGKGGRWESPMMRCATQSRSLQQACCAASGVEAEVCADIAARQQRGIQKYGTTVEANPLSLEQWLTHAYEECLDQAVYLKKAIAVTKQPNERS